MLWIRSTKQEDTQIQRSATLTEILIPPSGKVFLQDLHDLKTVCAFCTDRKLDKNNWACGEMYRTQIARYKRRVRYGCLGTESDFTDNKSVTADRYFTQNSLLPAGENLLYPLKEFMEHRRGFHAKPSTTSSQPFIPLSASGPDNITCHDSDRSTCTAEDHGTDLIGRKKSVELNKLLADNPRDIGSWLELVRCQVSEVSSDSLSRGSTPDKVASAVADIQAAILDRALEKNPSSIELKLVQLEVCHGRWEVENIAAEWKKLVFQHAGDPYVWKQYLHYVRSSFRTFSTTRVTSAYVRAISTLRGARDGTLLSHKAPPMVTTHIIGKSSGYNSFIYRSHYQNLSLIYIRPEQIIFFVNNCMNC